LASAQKEFLEKYLARKKEISSVKQQVGEILYDVWGRFKLLVKRCLDHKFTKMDIIKTSTIGLKPLTRMLLDASAEGIMKIKTVGKVRELTDYMSLN